MHAKWTVDSPDKIFAVGAERGLLEEARNEAVILHVVDVFLLQSTLPATIPQQQFAVHMLLRQILFRHCRCCCCCCCGGWWLWEFSLYFLYYFELFYSNNTVILL